MRARDSVLRTELSLRVERDRGGPVAAAVHGYEALHRSGAHRVLLLVHGFNNDPKQARDSYTVFTDQMLNTLADRNVEPDAVAGLQWPGNAAVGPVSAMDVAGYPVDVRRAMEAGERLADYLQNPGTPAFSWVIIGHSLGCRVVLEALRHCSQAPVQPEIQLVALMAAASPVNLSEPGRPLHVAQMPQQRIVKYHSTHDMVLWLAFPLGQSVSDDGGGVLPMAIGRHGEPTGLGYGVQTTNGHSQYWSDKGIANAVARFYDPALQMPPRTYALPPSVEIEARALESRAIQMRRLAS